LGGIPTIIRDFTVKYFSTGSYFISREKFVDLMKLLRKKKITLTTWKRGDKFLLKNGMEIVVLNPGPETGIDDLNNASLVMRIGYGNFSILFAGDIGSDVEEKLILAGNNLRADVLKIPHHGSRHSSSHEFLAAVQPKIALLSVGKGILGIPSHEALKRYDALSIPVLRTDRDGMIKVWKNKDGVKYSVHNR
jgi:competence protein ComEC